MLPPGGPPLPSPIWVVINTLTSGMVAGGMLLLLILLGQAVNLRAVFINASPVLYDLLSFGGLETAGLLFVAGALCSLFAGVLYLLPGSIRKMLTVALVSIVGAGVLQDMLRPTLTAWETDGGCC